MDPPAIRVHTQTKVVEDARLQFPTVYMQITQLDHTLHIWLGDDDGNMGDLAVAVVHGVLQSVDVSSSQLLDAKQSASSFAETFARRMARKYPDTQMYCSCSLDRTLACADEMVQMHVERVASDFVAAVLAV